jgi:hypothetical protein
MCNDYALNPELRKFAADGLKYSRFTYLRGDLKKATDWFEHQLGFDMWKELLTRLTAGGKPIWN